MEFRLLGRLEVSADGRDLTPPRPRERTLLGILLLRQPRVVGTDELIDLLWGESPPPTARTALHGLVSGLRRSVGAERLATLPPGYALRLLPGDGYDVARFERLVEDAAGAPPALRVELLREALSLVRGEPLDGLDVAVDMRAEVARLDSLRRTAEEEHVAAQLAVGRHREVLPRLEHLVAEQPLREALRAQLMVALYRLGRQADALRVAQDARTVLATELGVEPGPALQQLERQILLQDPSLLASTPPADVAMPVAEPGTGPVTFLAIAPADPTPLDEAIREVALSNGGAEVTAHAGAAFAFARARDAATAAAAMQRAGSRAGAGLRIGLHSVTAAGLTPLMPDIRDAGAAQGTRVAALAQPGQILMSRATRDLLRETPGRELDVRDLGEHRLADLGARQPLYQLVAPGLRADFAPTRGLDALRTNLPIQSSTFVDRRSEVAEIAALLRDPEIRLITLTGPGGTGKTRLALHAAAEVVFDMPGGTWFVPLESLADPSLVAPAVATALGLPVDDASVVRAIARELDGTRTLLYLDNFEHLLPAAPTIAELLGRSGGLTVLVTSRIPLGVEGERVVAVSPLPVPERPDGGAPDLPALLEVGSVALFSARAAAVRPDFTLTPGEAVAIAELCHTLDGLPLAIELAASRVALMSPGTVLERLDEPLRLLNVRGRAGPERHRALEAAIDWSHELLDTDVRRLFAGLSVFAGGWTLEAAEAVCRNGVDVVDGLAGLVDHSLVRVDGGEGDPRFRMLATIREYAAARLATSERREETEARHASYFLALAERAEPNLRGNPGESVARLDAEHDNLRAALDRLARRSDPAPDSTGAGDAAAIEAALAGALWRFWYLAGHLREGRRRLEHAAAVHVDETPARLKVLIGAAVMAQNEEEFAVAAERAAEAATLARSLDDRWSLAYATFMLGNTARSQDDVESARRDYEASVRAFRDLGDEHSALLAARGLAGALRDDGERDAARKLLEDNLRRARADSNGRVEASTLGELATIAFEEARVTDATLLLRESLRLHRELGDRLDTAVDLGRAAQVLALRDHPVESARLLGFLTDVRGELGIRGRVVASMAQTTRASLGRQLSPAELDRLAGEGSRLRLEAVLELALEALG